MNFSELPAACKKKLLARLKDEHKKGNRLTRDELDFIHMETTEENLAYWTDQHQKADDKDEARITYCDGVRRNILVALRAKEPPVGDMDANPLIDGLSEFLTRIDQLPAVH